jgi:uncharacterized protein
VNPPGKAGFVRPTMTNVDATMWWRSMAKGELTMPECTGCSHRFFPPQPFCPQCGAVEPRMVAVSGAGNVYSWVVVNRSFAPEFDDDVPYGIVAVDMVDGGRLIGRFTGEPLILRADLNVRALVERRDDFGLLWFEPA